MSTPEGISYVSEGDGAKVPIQVESGGNEDMDDFYLSHRSYRTSHSSIPSVVHGRTPIMKHTQNEEGEGKDGLEDSTNNMRLVAGEKMVAPEQFYRYPSTEEVQQFVPAVRHKLKDACDFFPAAHGLVIAFSSEVGCEESARVPNIHASSENLCHAFSQLGYATCTFKEPHKVEILAVYRELAAMTLPDSYGAIFIYFTGHGQKFHISTKDGYISINQLKHLLSESSAPSLRDLVKVLIFDCCRTSAHVKSISQSPSVENLIIFYTTPLGQKSFVLNERGMSVATIELVKLLQWEGMRSLVTLFSVDLCREVKVAARRLDVPEMRTDFEGSLNRTVNLHDDKIKAMAPREVQLTENCATDRCVLSWSEPLHASHQGLEGYSITCNTSLPFNSSPSSPRSIHAPSHLQRTWEVLRERLPATETSMEFLRAEVCGKGLTVVAHYSRGRNVNAAEVDMCPEAHLESEGITPGDVRLNVSSSGEATLTWQNSVCVGGDERVTIQRRAVGKGVADASEEWEVIGKTEAEDHSYSISGKDAENFDYRINVKTEGMTSPWVAAVRPQGCSKYDLWCRLRQRWNLKCYAFSTILLFILLIGLSYIVVDRSFVRTLPKHNILAVAGDMIDCSGLDDSWHKVFYSSVSITQVATDVVNDNPLGLSMEIASLDRRDLKFHPRNLSGTFEDTLSNKTNVFVIPEGIFQHPVYMWAGSNVTIDVMMNYSVWPKELTAYVILGDQNLNSFFSNPWVTPKHEYKFSLLENTHQTYHYTFRKNGYFFIAVRVQTDEESNFTANVLFDYSAIIKSDYNFKHGQTLATVKSTLSEALDIRDQELVVCAIDDQPDSYSRFTIHLDLAYGLRKSIVYILPLVLVPILVLVLMSLFAKYLFSRCQSRAHSQSQYHRLNGVNS